MRVTADKAVADRKQVITTIDPHTTLKSDRAAQATKAPQTRTSKLPALAGATTSSSVTSRMTAVRRRDVSKSSDHVTQPATTRDVAGTTAPRDVITESAHDSMLGTLTYLRNL